MTAIIYKQPRPNQPDVPTHAAIPPMNIYFHFYYQEIKIVAVHRSVGHLNIREDLSYPDLFEVRRSSDYFPRLGIMECHT